MPSVWLVRAEAWPNAGHPITISWLSQAARTAFAVLIAIALPGCSIQNSQAGNIHVASSARTEGTSGAIDEGYQHLLGPGPANADTPSPAPTPSPTPAAPSPVIASPSPSPKPPSAPGSPYVGGASGYDLSYPQCSNPGPPPGASFTVLGVNHGKAFSTNQCLANEWQLGVKPRALYLNTGYNPDNSTHITNACQSSAASSGLSGAYATAYAIGCSESDFSLGQVSAVLGSWQPLMWWLDVETGNSWSGTDLDLNRAALKGALVRLAQTGLDVGVYSTASQWQSITGGWTNSGISADWVAGTDASSCGQPGYSGSPVWLVQLVPTSSTDIDQAC
jgi:hypothetical protein